MKKTIPKRCDCSSKNTILNSEKMTQNYVFMSLSTLVARYGEEKVQNGLNNFNPYLNDETVQFIRDKAIMMERRDLSRTYLAITKTGEVILGYVTIGMKCLRIPDENMLSSTILRQMNIEESTGVSQSYLFGQLARSKESPEGFGDKLIDYALKVFGGRKGWLVVVWYVLTVQMIWCNNMKDMGSNSYQKIMIKI